MITGVPEQRLAFFAQALGREAALLASYGHWMNPFGVIWVRISDPRSLRSWDIKRNWLTMIRVILDHWSWSSQRNTPPLLYPHSQLANQKPYLLISWDIKSLTCYGYDYLGQIWVQQIPNLIFLIPFGSTSGSFGLAMGILSCLHLATIWTMARPGMIRCKKCFKVSRGDLIKLYLNVPECQLLYQRTVHTQ